MGINISIKLNSLDHFYSEANKLENTGNKTIWNNLHTGKHYSPDLFLSFVGLPYDEIIKNKYSYKEGLNKLEEINQDLNLGGSVKKFKYDEFDGDDVNYDRLLEQLPAFKKRIRTIGSGNGKFINLHVNIAELFYVDYKNLMYRSYTVMSIIDYLENLGYRIGLSVYTDTKNLGLYKDKTINLLHVEVEVKKPDEPLIKPLLLTSISSWMFRYWMFKFRAAKFNVYNSMGSTAKCDYTDTESDLYIRAGECLNKKEADIKIKAIQEYYDNL